MITGSSGENPVFCVNLIFGLHKPFAMLYQTSISQSRLKCVIKSALTGIWIFDFLVIANVYIILCLKFYTKFGTDLTQSFYS